MPTTETKEITNSEDVIDLRDVTERVEALEEQLVLNVDETVAGFEDESDQALYEELVRLRSLLDDLRGDGGDHDWRDNWYPLLLVRDSYFEDFAQQEAEDLDLIKSDMRWPYTCIDWEKAAEELQVDYTTVEFDGVTYWYR